MEDGPNRKTVRARRPIALFLVATLVALASSARAESVNKPSLTTGDFWTYRTNTSFDAGFELEGQVTSFVMARTPATILNLSLDVFRIVVNGSGTLAGQVSGPLGTGSVSGTWIVTGEELLETSQLRVVSNVVDLAVDGTVQGAIPFSIRATNTTLYRVLSDDWQFPIPVGGNGSLALSYNYVQDFFAFGNQSHSSGSGNLTLRYHMGPAAPVSTPAGSFAAYPIQETLPDGTMDRAYFSPAVGNDVKTERLNETGSPVSTTTLESFRYQALEPPRFLGLTFVEWGILVVVIAGGALAAIVLRRRSRKKRVLPPSLREPGT